MFSLNSTMNDQAPYNAGKVPKKGDDRGKKIQNFDFMAILCIFKMLL